MSTTPEDKEPFVQPKGREPTEPDQPQSSGRILSTQELALQAVSELNKNEPIKTSGNVHEKLADIRKEEATLAQRVEKLEHFAYEYIPQQFDKIVSELSNLHDKTAKGFNDFRIYVDQLAGKTPQVLPPGSPEQMPQKEMSLQERIYNDPLARKILDGVANRLGFGGEGSGLDNEIATLVREDLNFVKLQYRDTLRDRIYQNRELLQNRLRLGGVTNSLEKIPPSVAVHTP